MHPISVQLFKQLNGKSTHICEIASQGNKCSRWWSDCNGFEPQDHIGHWYPGFVNRLKQEVLIYTRPMTGGQPQLLHSRLEKPFPHQGLKWRRKEVCIVCPAVGRIGGLAVCKGLEGLQLKRRIWKIAWRAQGMQFWFVLLQTGAVLMSCLVCLVLGSWFAVWGFIYPWCCGRVQIFSFLLDKSLPQSSLAVHAVLTVRGWFVRCLESLSMHTCLQFRCVAARRSGMLFFATGCIQKWLLSSPVGGRSLGALLHGGVSQVRLVKACEVPVC
eukprot:Gb_09256 [translate_table: standard]